MKKLATILLLLFSCIAHGQWLFNFDTPPVNDFMFGYFIDSTQPGNIWQVGRPQKTVFNAAYTQPNALVTDTVNPYPIYDTSSFILYHARDLLLGVITLRLQFYYKLDVAAQATAKLEMSGDRGANWIDVLAEDTTYHIEWLSGKPRLDTSVHTWTYVDMKLKDWIASQFTLAFPHNFTADSILFRFTFRSGNVIIPHDGWMIDNLGIVDSGIGDRVPLVRFDDLVKVYPNPSNGTMTIAGGNGTTGDLDVYSIAGVKVYERLRLPANSIVTLPLANGPYILKYSDGRKYAIKQILITH